MKSRFLEFQVCAVVLLRPARDPVPYCHCQYHNTHPDPPFPASSWSQPSLRGPGQPPACRAPGPAAPAAAPHVPLAVTRRRTVWHWSMRRTRSPAASDLAWQPEAHRRVGSESLAVRPLGQPATGSDSEPDPSGRPPSRARLPCPGPEPQCRQCPGRVPPGGPGGTEPGASRPLSDSEGSGWPGPTGPLAGCPAAVRPAAAGAACAS